MNNPIPLTDLKEMVIEVTHLSTNSSHDLLNDLHDQQPVLIEYLEYLAERSPVADDASVFSQVEYRYIYLISVVMLKMLLDSRYLLREVTWDDLNATIVAGQPVANDIFRDPANLPDIVQRLAEDHPEPHLLRFLGDACQKRLDDKPDLPPIRAKYRPTAFLIFYTILTTVLNIEEG